MNIKAQQRRTDFAKFASPVTTPAGYLIADAYLTRTGVFVYRDGAGNVTRELRHPDDVFAAKSLATMALIPVTDLHPGERVDATTARKYQRGSVGENVTRDGEYVRAKVSVTDADLQKKIRDGQDELSCGYTTDIVEESGTYEGEAYDVRQTNIVYDHLASVPVGRAGREVRMRLDGAHQVRSDVDDDAAPNNERHTVKIKIDGIETEVSDTAGQLIEAALAKRDGQIGTLTADASKEKTRADAAEQKAKDAEKARADAAAPEKVREMIKARVEIEKIATKLKVEKVDSLDDAALKRACIAAAHPDLKLDGQNEHFVDGVYRSVADTVAKADAAIEQLKTVLGGGNGNGQEQQNKDAYDALRERNEKALEENRKKELGK